MKTKHIYISVALIFFSLILISSASALLDTESSSYTEISDFANGLTLEAPSISIMRVNTNFTFYVKVFNSSNGYPFNRSQVDCSFLLHDSRGNIILRNVTPSVQNQYDIYVIASGNNFSRASQFAYTFACNNSVSGGFIEVPLEATNNGDVLSISGALIYIFVLILGILLFIVLCYGAISIPYSNKKSPDGGIIISINWSKYVKLFCIVFAYLTFTWLSWTAYNITLAYTAFVPAANYFMVIYRILISAIIPIGVVFVILSVIRFVLDLKIEKEMNKGFKVKSNEY